MNGSKRQYLNNIVMLLVLTIALEVHGQLTHLENEFIYIPLTLLSATGLYLILIKLLLTIISNVDFFMKMYWGELYLNGFWSYEYTREGKKYFGIWRIIQDLDSIRIMGLGLNDDFLPRTTVRSISPLISEQGIYYVLNVKSELASTDGFIIPVYSKTTLTLGARKTIFSLVTNIRATTEVYGGKSNGHLHSDVLFSKHLDVKSEEDVILLLRKNNPPIKNSRIN